MLLKNGDTCRRKFNIYMDFGRLPNVDQVDFGLPEEPSANKAFFEQLNSKQPVATNNGPKIWLGPTGYNMKAWVGSWYPAGTKEPDFLPAYGQLFNTIEHNTTHYRIPEAGMVERWREAVPTDFHFCPKVPQIFSHARDMGLSDPQLLVFWERMAMFEEKLGYCFLQLPPYFEPRNLGTLARFLQQWPRTLPLAVEVRHESFFRNSQAQDQYFGLLETMEVAAVITDVAGRRDVCHLRLTAPCTMVRFVGNALHASDYSRIDEWAEKLASWAKLGLKKIYFFTHEPDNLLAPELAAYAFQVFNQRIHGATLRGPVKPSGTGIGVQGSLF
jgi:uncharacterized protein YecE (DUF72 family)